MNGCLKAALIGGGICALLAVVLVGGSIWFVSANKDELVNFAKEADAAGIEMAKGQNQNACIDGGFEQFDACDGITCQARLGVTLGSCLARAEVVPELCEGVPPGTEFKKSMAYLKRGCDHLGYAGHPGCQAILQAIQQDCFRRAMMDEARKRALEEAQKRAAEAG